MTVSIVPINDLRRVPGDLQAELAEAAAATLGSGWFLNGQRLDAFCRAFADYLGVADCVGVANGTDALEIAMRAVIQVRAPSGSEVVTVANAGGYSSFACRLLGLVPVYADIDEATQLASLDSILACIGADTALVVATHLYGSPLDIVRLRTMMDAAGHAHVTILEDCAQAHGATVNGRRVGSLGDIATFSFYPTKNLGASGDAGAIVSNDPALLDRVRSLSQYGWGKKYEIVTPLGRNSRLDEVQAALLSVLLPRLDAGNARRRAIVQRYIAAAPPGVTIVDGGDGSVGHLAVALCDDRDGMKAHLAARGIATEVHYPILDVDQPAWQALPQRTAPGGLPVSRRSVSRLLTLPCFPQLDDDEVDRVCAALAEWQA